MQEIKKIVVIGANGRLGCSLLNYQEHEFELKGYSRVDLDLSKPHLFDEILGEVKFDLLVNTAAMTNVDACEQGGELATVINQESPRKLAEICSSKSAKMVQISTDYVFSGDKEGMRKESDSTTPRGVYAKTKLGGEKEVLSVDPSFVILRTSWLYGPHKPSFIDWLVGEAKEKKEVSAVDDKFSSPTYSRDFSEYFFELIKNETASGIYHVCNEGECSWKEFGQEAINYLSARGYDMAIENLKGISVHDLKHFGAPRPKYTAMSVDRLAEVIGKRPRSWQEALHVYLERQYLASS